MGRAGLCVGMAVAALFVGGCGVAASSEPGASGSTPVARTTSTSTPLRLGPGGEDALSPGHGPEFPLTLRRTGGIAGFDDRIVLGADGRLSVDTRTVHGRVCTLRAPQQRQLVTLLATLRLGPVSDLPTSEEVTPTEPELTESDPITISVTDDRQREIDLSDPSLGEIAGLVGVLVSDVTLSVPATTSCSTPTATSTSGAMGAAPAP